MGPRSRDLGSIMLPNTEFFEKQKRCRSQTKGDKALRPAEQYETSQALTYITKSLLALVT